MYNIKSLFYVGDAGRISLIPFGLQVTSQKKIHCWKIRQARRPVNVFAVVSHCRNITALLSALKIPVEFSLVHDMMFCLVKERTVAVKLFITTW